MLGGLQGALSNQQNLSKICKSGKWYRNFQKFRKLLNFRNANHSTKIVEIPGAKLNGKKTSGKTTTYAQIFGNLKFPKIWDVVVNFLSDVIFVFGYGNVC